MADRLHVLRPGLVPYHEAYELQQRIADDLAQGGNPTLVLLEHPPTFTLGRRANSSNVLTSTALLREAGAKVVQTDRGGDVTFHGPGQVVGYGIVNLRRAGIGVSEYVCWLEQSIIAALAAFGISGERSERNRGVWVGDAKVAAIGVRVARGVTTHGFALNVNTDLRWFDHIVPCGLPDVRVTSMTHVLGHGLEMLEVEDALVQAFAARFQLEPLEMVVA